MKVIVENQAISSTHESGQESDLEPLKKARQSVKVLARTVYCGKCLSQDRFSRETASFYCPCGSFLCVYHAIAHKCLVTASVSYEEELLNSLV